MENLSICEAASAVLLEELDCGVRFVSVSLTKAETGTVSSALNFVGREVVPTVDQTLNLLVATMAASAAACICERPDLHSTVLVYRFAAAQRLAQLASNATVVNGQAIRPDMPLVYLEQAYVRAVALVKQHEVRIKRVADALERQGFLTAVAVATT